MKILSRHVALPIDHGSWVMFLGPLAIGICAGGRWHTTVLYLVVAATCAFLVRQPITLVVKVHAGRRSRDTLTAAWFWIAVYTGVALLHVAGLVLRGFGYLLYLAAPGILVFGWYLYLLSRREERRQMLVEILAAGVMALVAPAGMWAGSGSRDPLGWFLWLLVWAQSATAIVFAYLRLEQRSLRENPDVARRLKLGAAALWFASVSLGGAVALGLLGYFSLWLFVPYLLQWGEVIRGVWWPAKGLKPTAIGVRQLAVSTIFTVLFIFLW